MKIILMERVAKLGQMGDIVAVKDGYARNFLLPARKAMRASDANIAMFDTQKAQLEVHNLETRKEAEGMADRLNGKQFVVIRSASEAGSLYGSVTTRDVAEAASEDGLSLSKKQIVLLAPIKELGLHDVAVQLHPEITTKIRINVARSAEEATLQASGTSIQEREAAEEAAAEFEIQELFDDIGAASMDDYGDGQPQPEVSNAKSADTSAT